MDKRLKAWKSMVYMEGREKGKNARNSKFLELKVSKYEAVRDENKESGRMVHAQLRSLDFIQLISP